MLKKKTNKKQKKQNKIHATTIILTIETRANAKLSKALHMTNTRCRG